MVELAELDSEVRRTWIQMLAPYRAVKRSWTRDFISLNHNFLRCEIGENYSF